jgi:tricorn protease
LAFSAAASAADSAFLSWPDIHGEKIVFTREGDLWIGNLNQGTAERLTRHASEENRAKFSPDGTQIAFSGEYEGLRQVYLVEPDGGIPQRVTTGFPIADVMFWTPDGEGIGYLNYNGLFAQQLHIQPLSGGPSERVPIEIFGTAAISPDGQRLAFTRMPIVSGGAWFRYAGGMKNDIFAGNLNTNEFRRVHEGVHPSEFPVWVQDEICFVKEDNATFSVVCMQPDGSDLRTVSGPYDLEVRELETDGERLIYVVGNRLEVANAATGNTMAVDLELRSDRRHMQPYLVDAEDWFADAALSPSAKRVLGTARGAIVSLPASEGESRVLKATPGVRYWSPVLSPEGDKIAYISDETRQQQLYVADADFDNPEALTSDEEGQLYDPTWSPDGEWLSFSDSKTQIRLLNLRSGEERVVSRAQSALRGLPHQFSPDSKWLLYMTQKPWANEVQQINLYDIENDEHHLVSDGMFDDISAAFSQDGKYLVFLSIRQPQFSPDSLFGQINVDLRSQAFLVPLDSEMPSPFLLDSDEEPMKEPEEEDADEEGSDEAEEEAPADEEAAEEDDSMKIDLDGLYQRAIRVPLPDAYYTQIAMVGNKAVVAGGGNIATFDIQSEDLVTVAPGGGFTLSQDGQHLLLSGPRVVSLNARNQGATSGQVPFGSLRVQVVPEKEWEQVFWEAWRLTRDFFYVENLHGADWDAIGEKYSALLPDVRSRSELTELIRWMQAETSVGHSYRGDAPNRFDNAPGAPAPAYLGIETEADGGYHRVTKIYDGDGRAEPSPLMAPGLGVEPGTYLISVAGQPATDDTRLAELLRGRAGSTVSVEVNDEPSNEDARTIYVQPISWNAQGALMERDWVKQNREYVHEESGGKVGYVYLGAMGVGDFSDFAWQYLPQRNLDGMIIDVRFNNGGWIGGVLANILGKGTPFFANMRNAQHAWSRFDDGYLGHLTAIINERSFSEGEGFPLQFKLMELGPIVGVNTAGAYVGSGPSWGLVDGGRISVPRYGGFTMEDGWAIEAVGVEPDIRVENDPTDYARGIDNQLDAAIANLLQRIEEDPIVRPVPPPDPVRAGTRG